MEVVMRITEVKVRAPDLINRLVDVWENSVRTTHLFLSDSEIKRICTTGAEWNCPFDDCGR